eukprot:TRINITY_DN8065_c0_g2_i2.p1 TRINITY_DN8065_c0_g2~~TRINITY_DN8065_c0_g2_i2.p1  ORF type:complete len:352 (+),score=88.09 TRINITY_DN8065_c0_g2_i2:44-1057(+)
MTDLQSTFEYFGLTGHVLSVAEETALTCSLAVLGRDFGQPVVLWGKVLGYEGDYLIAQTVPLTTGNSVPISDLGKAKSFYCTDGGHNWTLLDESLTELQTRFCEQIRGRFMGNPSHVYKIKQSLPEVEEPVKEVAPAAEASPKPADGEEEEEEEADEKGDEEKPEDEEEEEDKDKQEAAEEGDEPPKKKKTSVLLRMEEAVRLSYFVLEHDRLCKVAPTGQMLLLDGKNVTLNKTFQGLSDALTLSNYCHVRQPVTDNLPQKQSPHYNMVSDFIEPLSTDIPEGVWKLRYDPSMSIVVGKNYMYPGTVFYHKANTRQFGQYYFGSGEVNADLCYMLP